MGLKLMRQKVGFIGAKGSRLVYETSKALTEAQNRTLSSRII